MIIYFQLQYKRLLRILKDFGINPYLGVILGVLVFVLLSSTLFNKIAYFEYVYVIIAVIAILQLGKTERNDFLKNIYTANNYLKLRLLENMAVALPFALFLLSKNFYACTLGVGFFSLLLPFYNNNGQSNFIIPSPFSKRPFEFTIGFRKYYWLFIIIYAVTAISIAVGNFNLGIFAYLGILIVCMSFYSATEPVFYVWVHSQQSTVFLKNKIKTALLYSNFISLPIAGSLVCYFPLKALIIVAVSACGALYIILGVVAKYTNYPNQISLLQVFMMSIGMVFPPILLVLIPHFFLKSAKKLNIYLK